MRRNIHQRGFTLIEMIVVVFIIIFLMTIGIVNMLSFIERSRDRGRKSDLAQIKAALEMYRSVNKWYPASLYATSCPNPSGLSDSYGTVYVKKIPCDPSKNSDYSYSASPAGCGAGTTCTSYILYACLEQADDAQKDTTTKTSPVDCSLSPFGASYTIEEQ